MRRQLWACKNTDEKSDDQHNVKVDVKVDAKVNAKVDAKADVKVDVKAGVKIERGRRSGSWTESYDEILPNTHLDSATGSL